MSQETVSKSIISLTAEERRAICRYEKTFADFLQGQEFDEVEFPCHESYQMTLDDLAAALSALMEKDPAIETFLFDWYYPLQQLAAHFGIDTMCGYADDDGDEVTESVTSAEFDEEAPVAEESSALHGLWYTGLKLTETDVFTDIWWNLDVDDGDYTPGASVNDVFILDGMLASIRRYWHNLGKPVAEMDFTEYEKSAFIRFYGEDDPVKNAPEEALSLCRRFIEELIPADNQDALRVKGYACYGGNRLYPCDFNISRECIQRLYELTDNPQYANTLGYIQYYGRCNGGTPQYEDSFRYFSVAAANGLFEGMYKLADHYRHGYACRQSDTTAKTLYEMVYHDSSRQFKEGHVGNFPDAALRMALVYKDGIAIKADPERAWYYLLQADYAARLRSEDDDFFGNTTVVMNIRHAMEEVRPLLPEGYLKDTQCFEYPGILGAMTAEHHRCTLSFVKEDGQEGVGLAVQRIPFADGEEPNKALITLGELSFCELTDSIRMQAKGNVVRWPAGENVTVRFDDCLIDRLAGRYWFLWDGTVVAWVKADGYWFTHEEPEAPAEDKAYTFASVRFSEGGRLYDYLCGELAVKPGDSVVVMGYDGETIVKVVKVYQKKASELPLPLDRYKTLLGKAEFMED